MRVWLDWKDFELLDASGKNRLERWGNKIFVRPDPQIIWKTPKIHKMWNKADAIYHRSSKGGGSWEYLKGQVASQTISWKELTFKVSPTGFKHMGLFPEQAVNWDFFIRKIRASNRPISVINLFAYTGGATLACAKAKAAVCHVDSSKGMVAWARENAKLSKLDGAPIRFIVDDCEKFIAREIRRGRKYDAVILDPPSYGRGPGGEVWKIEDKIYDLLKMLSRLLSKRPLFFALNSYTQGLSAQVMKILLKSTISDFFENFCCDEIGLRISQSGFNLPCGNTTIAWN